MNRILIIILLILTFSINSLSTNETNHKNNIFSTNKESKMDVIDFSQTKLAMGLYLTFGVFPVTNLLFSPFYFPSGLYSWWSSYVIIPISILCIPLSTMITSIALFSTKGYKYFLNLQNKEYRNYFIGSVVCFSLTYIINLLVTIITTALSWPSSKKYSKNKLTKFNLYINDNKIDIFISQKIYFSNNRSRSK